MSFTLDMLSIRTVPSTYSWDKGTPGITFTDFVSSLDSCKRLSTNSKQVEYVGYAPFVSVALSSDSGSFDPYANIIRTVDFGDYYNSDSNLVTKGTYDYALFSHAYVMPGLYTIKIERKEYTNLLVDEVLSLGACYQKYCIDWTWANLNSNYSLLPNVGDFTWKATQQQSLTNAFEDNSINKFPIKLVGAPTVAQNSPFATTIGITPSVYGSSGFFNGSSCLSAAAKSAYDPNPEDFTIECWFNIGYRATNPPGSLTLFSLGNSNASSWKISCNSSTKRIDFLVNNSSTTGIQEIVSAAVVDKWYHIALVKRSTTVSIYINGVLSKTKENVIVPSGPLTFIIGGDLDTTSNFWYGNVTNLRIVKGLAVYTTNFTPSKTQVTRSSNGTVVEMGSLAPTPAQTSLLLNFGSSYPKKWKREPCDQNDFSGNGIYIQNTDLSENKRTPLSWQWFNFLQNSPNNVLNTSTPWLSTGFQQPDQLTWKETCGPCLQNLNYHGTNIVWKWDNITKNKTGKYITKLTWDETRSTDPGNVTWDFANRFCSGDTVNLVLSTGIQTITHEAFIRVLEIPPQAFLEVIQPEERVSPLTVTLSPKNIISGSFPIEKIVWDLGDGSPLLVQRRWSPTIKSPFVFSGALTEDYDDPRNFDIVYTYRKTPGSPYLYYPSLTAYSSSTGTFDTAAAVVGPLKYTEPPVSFDLIQSELTDKGKVILGQVNKNIAIWKADK